MKVSELKLNQIAVITRLNQDEIIKKRLLELGFVPETILSLVKTAPFMKTFLVKIRGYYLALDKKTADLIEVELLK